MLNRLIREILRLSGKSQGIPETSGCGNHVISYPFQVSASVYRRFRNQINTCPLKPHRASEKEIFLLNKLSLVDSVLVSTPLSFVIFYPLYV